MNRWLQPFSFKKSFYERPNQKWICGRACQGQGCLTGPDAHGHCGAGPECRPLRKGDRWFCTRTEAHGGPCADGPAPDGSCRCVIPKCNPVRSLRSWRGLIVLWVTGLSLAGLLFAFGTSFGVRFFSPGPLSFAHASVGSKCSDCHAGVGNDPLAWLTSAAKTASVRSDSHMCLQCHNVGLKPFQPHSLPPNDLALISSHVITNASFGASPPGLKVARLVAGPVLGHGDELVCATCHQEHHGNQYDLRKLSNQQCQSCHARQFKSFANGHPDFVTYPFERRTRIIFDHAAHFSRHFLDPAQASLAPRTCVDCHQTDVNGNTMGLKPFEVICAACHRDQIKGKGAVSAGLAIISLPHFDDRVMTGKYAIGEWPEDADQKMTPFMRLLLSSDPGLRHALQQLAGTDLGNLPADDTNKLAAAQQLAWGIKGLIYDLGRLGQDELSRRLELALGHPITVEQREGVTAFLNAEVMRSAFQSSFPHLQSEMLGYRKQQNPAKSTLVPSPDLAPPPPDQQALPDAWVSNGGWYTTDGSFGLFYRPRGHADRFLKSWLEITLADDRGVAPEAAGAVFDQLSSTSGVGYCAKCHSVDHQPKRLVNWRGEQPDANLHPFNRFSHSAHLSLINNLGCFTCHPLKIGQPENYYMDAFQPGQYDAAKFNSNFQVINKAICANCHKPGKVQDDCLLCHNYHVGTFRAVIANGRIHAQLHPAAPANPGEPESDSD